jgi:hypothetical protein
MFVSLTTFPLPFINFLSTRSPEGQSNTGGPIGIQLGLDYFYQPGRFLSFTAGAGTSEFADHIGKGYYNVGRTFFGGIRHGHALGSFLLSYGLSVSDLQWARITLGDTVNRNRSVRNTGIGPSLAVQYRINKYFRLGVLYQPTLFSFNLSPSLGYQHYLLAGLAWNWQLRK